MHETPAPGLAQTGSSPRESGSESRGDKPYISVVTPVFNEEENVGTLYERVKEVLARESSRYEIIFVDDGSTDGTATRIATLHEKDAAVKMIGLSRNFGHQMALTAGLDHAAGDVCITMDSDLQHPPDTIPKFLEKWRQGFEIVSGVRTGPSKRPWLAEMLSRLYYFIHRRLSNIDLDSHVSDFRLMDRRVVEALRATRESTRFLRGLVKWLGFRATTIPYEPGERFRGAPRYTLKKRVDLAGAGLFSFSVVPLRMSMITGLLLSVLSVGGSAWAFIARFCFRRVIEGWMWMTLIFGFAMGLQLIFLGILGEYVGLVLQEVKRRPLYLVRSRLGILGEGAGSPEPGASSASGDR